MGGFVFDIKTSDGASDPLTRRYVPNSKAFLLIMDTFPEIIPDVSEESITDRAESSPMSKALLIVQVGWFCANCLSRLIQHLPLSLLEVSTAAHGFCTLLTYLVWWSKPQNIAEGIPFNGEPAKVQAAFNKLMQAENGQQLYFHSDFLSATPGASYTYLLPPRLYDGIPFIIAPIFYGLPHFLGWSKLFPYSTRESNLAHLHMCRNGLRVLFNVCSNDYPWPQTTQPQPIQPQPIRPQTILDIRFHSAHYIDSVCSCVRFSPRGKSPTALLPRAGDIPACNLVKLLATLFLNKYFTCIRDPTFDSMCKCIY